MVILTLAGKLPVLVGVAVEVLCEEELEEDFLLDERVELELLFLVDVVFFGGGISACTASCFSSLDPVSGLSALAFSSWSASVVAVASAEGS